MENTMCPSFPCESLPESAREARLLGLYPMRREGLLMQRIKACGGRLTPQQWKAVAELAMRYTPEFPLHLTTRQDLEFHGLKPADVAAVQKGLHEAGITTVGACGDTLRNVTVCPGCDRAPGLMLLAAAIRKEVCRLPWIFDMPRKFKISLSGCSKACAYPWINDLGLIANPDGTLQAVFGGSLGPRPATGILCYEKLSGDEVVSLALAALRLFEAEGDRGNRLKARLRHVRERLGDETFRALLEKRFHEEKAKPHASVDVPAKCNSPALAPLRLHVPHGDIAASEILQLVSILEVRGGALHIGFNHDIILFGIEPVELPPEWERRLGAPCVLACPGAHLCERGIAETWDVADAVREALPKRCELMVAVGGCPNNCVRSAVADIGLLGRIKKVDGQNRSCYRLLAGGGRGCTPALAHPLHPAVPKKRVGEVISWLVSEWSDASPDGTLLFGDFIVKEKERLSRQLACNLKEDRNDRTV